MNDKEIERAAINELLKEAKHTEARNKLPENGLGINKRLLSQNLVSTLRNPIFSRKFQKHRVIGLDDETESDYEDDANHAKWKRDGDYGHLGDDDYIYDARDYFNPQKYREIVAYRCQKLHKYKSKSSKTHRSAKDAHSSRHGCHGHPSKYVDSPQKQKRSECEDVLSEDGPVNSSRKKKHHKDKDRVKKTKHRKKSKHKHCDDSVDKVFEEHKKHAKHKKHKKDKLSKRKAKKSKRSKSSHHSNDQFLTVDVLESPPHDESYSFSLPKPLDRYDDLYDSKYNSRFNGYHGDQISESCRSPENEDAEYVDGTEISYEDCSPNLRKFSNDSAYF